MKTTILLIYSYLNLVFPVNKQKVQSSRPQTTQKFKNLLNPDSIDELTLNMEDFHDMQYAITIEFGSDNQPLTIDLDTGSSDIWVADSICEQCQKWTGLDKKPIVQFNSKLSNTFHSLDKNVSLKYGSGNITGTEAVDFIELNNDKDLRMKQGFITLQKTSMKSFNTSGLAGMAFPTLQAYKTDMLIQNLYKNKYIDKEIFMFNLLNTDYSVEAKFRHGFFLGEADIKQYLGDNWNSINWIDVTPLQPLFQTKPDYYYWNTVSSQTKIDNNYVDKKVYSIVDTGTSFVYVVKENYGFITNYLSNKLMCFEDKHEFICECDDNAYNSLDNISFTLNGLELELPPMGYMIRDKNTCLLTIMENTGQMKDLQIFGDTFIKFYDVVFDFQQKKIGFNKKDWSAMMNMNEIDNKTNYVDVIMSHIIEYYMYIVFGVIAMVMVVLIGFVCYRYKVKKQLREEIEEQEQYKIM